MEHYLAMGRISMPVSKVGPLATLMVVLIGCGADSGGSLADSFEPPEACSFPPGPSRWAGGSYRETARAGNTEDVWFASIGGVHWADDELYVFDMGNARVVRLTSDLAYVGSFGREGDGPGEFLKWRLPGGVPWRRLHGSNGLLVVFDEGRRVSLFDAKGNFRENLISDPAGAGMSITIRGVRLTPYGLFFDWNGQYAPDRPPVRADSVPYQVRRWANGTVSPVLELTVAANPIARPGVPFRGPTQARPLWDVAGSCVVASDGASPWLVVASIDGSHVDTLAIELPDRRPPALDRRALAQLDAMAGGGGHIPEPTAILRIRDLILDPDGHVWLLPIQPDPAPSGGVEVLLVSIATGETVVDTVPIFPAAFGPPGVYFGMPRTSFDEPMVARIEMKP